MAAKRLPAAAPDAIDVRAYGAAGNGRNIDTQAINAAIETAASQGGGIVRIPAGDYLCHTIHLKDGITLYLERGAILRAAPSEHFDLFQPNRWDQYQDFGHSHWHNSMICGVGVKDVAIAGPGLICGKGLSRGEISYTAATRGGADKIIALKECRNVSLSGFSVTGTPHIAILATGVGNLKISRILVDVGRDGIDIDCCENVVVEDSAFNTPHDDSIVLKSSNALGYRRPTANVQIRNCLVTGGFRPGTLYDGSRVAISASEGMKARIKIGTESCWGFERISVENCLIWNALGIPLLAVDGGALKNVGIRDIAMRNIQDAPLFMRLGSRLRAPAGATVAPFTGVSVENLTCDGFRMPLAIAGIPGHRIADVTLRNIELVQHGAPATAEGGGWIPLAVGFAASEAAPPEKASDYPEAGMFGPLPARFLFARHVETLAIENLRLKTSAAAKPLPAAATASEVPLFWFDDIEGARFADIHAPDGANGPICNAASPCRPSVTLSGAR
ncbi:MAG TPA: glycosyl hydrolase family 28-related protein [Stellaceae bacterium]|jgi:polygalacturonase|nr:glycosyl hydrolase family 28-related protein [Stellaceae bacterium]